MAVSCPATGGYFLEKDANLDWREKSYFLSSDSFYFFSWNDLHMFLLLNQKPHIKFVKTNEIFLKTG